MGDMRALARDLPETALHATSRRPTTQSPAAPFTCAVVWSCEALRGDLNHRRIDGKDGVAGSTPAGLHTAAWAGSPSSEGCQTRWHGCQEAVERSQRAHPQAARHHGSCRRHPQACGAHRSEAAASKPGPRAEVGVGHGGDDRQLRRGRAHLILSVRAAAASIAAGLICATARKQGQERRLTMPGSCPTQHCPS
jgi:hypothetical protein